MYVRWQRAFERPRRSRRHCYNVEVASEYAILVESVRVDGKPRQRHVAYLGSIHHWTIKEGNVNYRAWWWHHMKAQLDVLGNRIGADRAKIEAALGKKVPPVTAEEVTAYDLQHQHLRWPKGQAGVPPRPPEPAERFAATLAAVEGRRQP